MSFQMKIDSPYPTASRARGVNESFVERHKEQVPQSKSNNSNDSNTSSGKEGIVQKLQEVLFTVRRDRDREHRSCDIAFEKLQSAKDNFEVEKTNFEAEQKKLITTRDEAEKTQKQIVQAEATIQHLQQKYRFQHEDLIRKRDKIEQLTVALEAVASQRNKSVLDARRRLDQQRRKYQKLERKENQESKNFLSTIISLAKKKERTDSLDNEISVDTTEMERGTKQKATDQKESSLDSCDLHEFREQFEKSQEEALARELKVNMDYAMLPKIISQKAQALTLENEAMQAEIARLQATMYVTENKNCQFQQN